ncbi:MAG: hypothetical protein R3194_03385 [Limnobacter sp.]|nr:hypothetical protein [Limnobacter sp.]
MKISETMRRRKEGGFIQAALLFGIALMTAVLGGFALANRTPTSQTDAEEAKVNASVILKQASDLRDGVQRYSADEGAQAVIDSMTFDTSTTTGLFDATSRYASPQIMPRSAFASADYSTVVATATTNWSAAHWRVNKTVTLLDMGTAAGVDPIVVIANVADLVCTRLNQLLYGEAFANPTSSLAMAVWAGSADGTSTPPATVDSVGTASHLAGADGLAEACVVASDGNVYYKVVQEN